MNVQHDRPSERGAVLVFVAISILVLAAFLTIVVDHGLLWVSRGQAQNAADAGALAAAVARAYDDLNDPPSAGGIAEQAAINAAQSNPVWKEAPEVQVSWTCPAGLTGDCARVDVYRNGQFGSNTLPMYFGGLLGISSHGVRATATARAANGNSVNCMRPFAVPDKWTEVAAPNDEYNHWKKQGNTVVELDPHDVYTPPSADGAGTGYTVEADKNTQLILKAGANPQSATDPITPGWNLPVRLPDGAGGYVSGGDDFRDAIGTCIGAPVYIGQYLPTENGVMNGPTSQGIEDLILQDPNATWNSSTNTVDSSCAPECNPFSPRIVPISVFDMEDFQYRRAANDWSVCPTGGKCVKVVNILGFFVEGMSGGDVVGRLLTYPGEFAAGGGTLGGGASFLVNIQLVR